MTKSKRIAMRTISAAQLAGATGSGLGLPEPTTTDTVYKEKKAFEIKDFSFGVANP